MIISSSGNNLKFSRIITLIITSALLTGCYSQKVKSYADYSKKQKGIITKIHQEDGTQIFINNPRNIETFIDQGFLVVQAKNSENERNDILEIPVNTISKVNIDNSYKDAPITILQLLLAILFY